MFDEAVAKGLKGFTLHFDRNGNWQASSRWGEGYGWRCITAATPDEAVRQTLSSQGLLTVIEDGSDLV